MNWQIPTFVQLIFMNYFRKGKEGWQTPLPQEASLCCMETQNLEENTDSLAATKLRNIPNNGRQVHL